MKTDCAFIDHSGDAPECRALNSCYCTSNGECSYYKTAATLHAEQAATLARLETLPGFQHYCKKYKSHLTNKSDATNSEISLNTTI